MRTDFDKDGLGHLGDNGSYGLFEFHRNTCPERINFKGFGELKCTYDRYSTYIRE
jgi:hypothetical protein